MNSQSWGPFSCFVFVYNLSWSSNTLATWWEEQTHGKWPWCWERLKAGGEGDDRGRGHWMASPTQRSWVWVNSRRWWRTGRPGCCSPLGHKESDTTERLNNKRENNMDKEFKKKQKQIQSLPYLTRDLFFKHFVDFLTQGLYWHDWSIMSQLLKWL